MATTLSSFSDCVYIIWEDFNCSVECVYDGDDNICVSSFMYRKLDDFCKQFSLKNASGFFKCDLDHSFGHATLNHRSLIDHFLVSQSICDLLLISM